MALPHRVVISPETSYNLGLKGEHLDEKLIGINFEQQVYRADMYLDGLTRYVITGDESTLPNSYLLECARKQ